MKSNVVLLFLLAECFFMCSRTVEGSPVQANNKKSLETKKTHLDRIHNYFLVMENQGFIDPSLGAPNYETYKYALMGSLSDYLNYQRTPRQLVNIKDYVVEKLEESGSFSVYVFMDSLADGDSYYRLKGVFDMEDLKVDLQFKKKLSRGDYEAAKASLPSSLFHSLIQFSGGNFTFNNGSKGEELTLVYSPIYYTFFYLGQ